MSRDHGERIHPVVLAVPEEIRSLPGRSRTAELSRLARVALARSADIGGLKLGPLETGERGRPLPAGGVHWSLTHTIRFVAGVAARFPIGVDVETIKDANPAVRERVAEPWEWELAPKVDALLFCRYWTAKESVLKAAGIGLGGLHECFVDVIVDDEHLRVRYRGERWLVSHYPGLAGHLASITVGADRVDWHIEEPTD